MILETCFFFFLVLWQIMMFKFLLSMLLALHTFPCFLSPFPHLIWNLEKFHSSQILEFTEPSSSSAVHYPLVYFQSVTCHVSGSTARAGVWLDWLEMQLETGAGLEFLRTTGMPSVGAAHPGQRLDLMISKVFPNLVNPGILYWCTGMHSPGEGRGGI